VVWLNLGKMLETMTYDKSCWIDCLKLGVNGTDPPDCKVRADEGLSAIGELSPGNIYTPPATSIFTSLIKTLASEFGYLGGDTLHGLPYDWRLAPIELERRDSFFTTFKFRLESTVRRHKRPAIVIAHSMGTNLFLYFVEWLKANPPKIGHVRWLRRHVYGFVSFAAPLLGAPGAIKSVLSGHDFGLTISEAQARELQLTYSSTLFLNPRSSAGLNVSSSYSSPSSSSSSSPLLDYSDPIVTVKSASGGSSLSFGIKDVENGKMLLALGQLFGEELLINKYRQLQSLYTADPLKPLLTQPRRPPIRHVVVVYGVDLPTEVGYTYAQQEDPAAPPLLKEVLYERVECDRGRDRQGQARESAASAWPGWGRAEEPEACPVPSAETEGDGSDQDNAPASGSGSGSGSGPVTGGKGGSCRAEIVSRERRGKKALGAKFVRDSDAARSGDVTVPYLSLSYAKTWLAQGQGSVIKSWEEHRDAVQQAALDSSWTAPGLGLLGGGAKTHSPAVDLFFSLQDNGDSTVVIEVSGVDHLDIAKERFAHKLVFDYLLPKIGKELGLGVGSISGSGSGSGASPSSPPLYSASASSSSSSSSRELQRTSSGSEAETEAGSEAEAGAGAEGAGTGAEAEAEGSELQRRSSSSPHSLPPQHPSPAPASAPASALSDSIPDRLFRWLRALPSRVARREDPALTELAQFEYLSDRRSSRYFKGRVDDSGALGLGLGLGEAEEERGDRKRDAVKRLYRVARAAVFRFKRLVDDALVTLIRLQSLDLE